MGRQTNLKAGFEKKKKKKASSDNDGGSRSAGAQGGEEKKGERGPLKKMQWVGGEYIFVVCIHIRIMQKKQERFLCLSR